MANARTIAGQKTRRQYEHVRLDAIIGKTIEAVTETTVEGAWGVEPCIELCVTDGTKHGFVNATDD
jgi:hypothetical protein